MKQMNNPRFMAAIQEFQTNPSSALLKYAGDREVQKFLQEFCSILGTLCCICYQTFLVWFYDRDAVNRGAIVESCVVVVVVSLPDPRPPKPDPRHEPIMWWGACAAFSLFLGIGSDWAFAVLKGACLCWWHQGWSTEALAEQFRTRCPLFPGAHFESYSEAKGKQPESTKPGAQHIRTSDSDGADISVRHTTSRREATADDEKKIQEILNDPELKDILLDPRIQKLLQTLKTDPEKAQR